MTAPNPFKGLAYFDSQDSSQFGGRERDTRALSSEILKHRTLVLYGRSGLGKTSLILAGVSPKLLQHGCRFVYVRALRDPVRDLHRALAEQLGGNGSSDPFTIIDRADDEGLVVIVFDQFEEFFIRFSPSVSAGGGDRQDELSGEEVRRRRDLRDEFIREVGALATASKLNLRIVFSLREDWFAEMNDFSKSIPTINKHVHRLLPLTGFGVRQSITKTLQAASVPFDARLISALVENLYEVNYDPAVLQVVCSEIWKQAVQRSGNGSVRLTLDDLEAVGGFRGIFQSYLDQVTRNIPESDNRLKIQTRAVLDSLITDKRTKRAVQKKFLLDRNFNITESELDGVLETLCEHRLVRLDPHGGEEWYELIHERLVETILGWLDQDLDFFNFRAARNLVVNSCANPGWDHNPGLLLTREQLDGTVGPYKDLLRFTDRELRFIVSSCAYSRSRDLEFWADLAGEDASLELLSEFLESDNDQLRLRGAEAVGRLPETGNRFTAHCLELAMEDSSEIVRRAAGRSFSRLATNDQFQDLKSKLQNKPTCKRSLEVLADAWQLDELPRDGTFGRQRLHQAHRLSFKRRLEEERETIRRRGVQGAFAGMFAGIAWGATAGALMVWVSLRELNPMATMQSPSTPYLFVAGVVVIALALGAMIGWRVAIGAARAAIYSGREGCFFRAVMGRRLFWILMAMFGISVAFMVVLRAVDVIDSGDFGKGLFAAVLFLLATYAFFACSGLVTMLAGVTVSPSGTTASRLGKWSWPGWLWAWAFGGSLILPALLWRMQDDPPDSPTWYYEFIAIALVLFTVVLASLGGLQSFAGAVALVRSTPGPLVGPSRLHALAREPESAGPWKRIVNGLIALLLIVVTFQFFYVTNRFDSLSIGRPKYALGDDELKVKMPFGSLRGDIGYFDVLVNGTDPRLVNLSLGPTAGSYLEPREERIYFGPNSISEASVLVLQPGRNRFWRRRGNLGSERNVHLIPGQSEPSPGTDVWHGFALPLKKKKPKSGKTNGDGSGTHTWEAELDMAPYVQAQSSPRFDVSAMIQGLCLDLNFELTISAPQKDDVATEVDCSVRPSSLKWQSLPINLGTDLEFRVTGTTVERPGSGSAPRRRLRDDRALQNDLFVFITGPQHVGEFRWQPSSRMQALRGFPGGKEGTLELGICRIPDLRRQDDRRRVARSMRGVFMAIGRVGKIVGEQCNVPAGDEEELVSPFFDVLVGPEAGASWVDGPEYARLHEGTAQDRRISSRPNSSQASGPKESMDGFLVCRARYENGLHPGSILPRPNLPPSCWFGYGGRAREAKDYEVLVDTGSGS